jgi:hypothetical protein
MGILKNKAASEVANAEAANSGSAGPAFESEEGDTAVVEKTVAVKTVTREQVAQVEQIDKVIEKEKEAATQGEQQEAAAETTASAASTSTEVAAASPKTGIVKHFLSAGKGMVNPLVDLRDAFKTAQIEVDYATFPRLRVDAGCIASTEGKEAGEFIELQVLSYSPSWTVTTGVDGKESKEHVRFSDDGKVTNAAGDADEYAGTPLDEYKQILINKGFEKASIKEYVVVYGIALDCEESDFPHLNEVVALALAPESRRKFDSYKINRALQARMGRVQETSGNPVVRWTSERVTGKERSYFNLLPSHGKTAPVDLG